MISKGTLSPITSRIADIQNLKTPESKTDVLNVLGATRYYSIYVIKYQIDVKPLFSLVKNDTNFEWLEKHQQVFDKLKTKFAHDVSVVIPNPKYPFHIHTDTSNLGTGNILIQQFSEGKHFVSSNSRVIDKAEQKKSPQHRELCGIKSALQTYEFYIIGSPYLIYPFFDDRPILFLWSCRGQLSSCTSLSIKL